MDFKDVVRKRRMVRNYRSDPVPVTTIERLVDIARRAPSAGFSQGQRFVVVTDEVTRRALAVLAEEDGYSAKGFDRWLSVAPVHVVVCVSQQAYRRRYDAADKSGGQGPEEWSVPYPLIDCGASLMLLLLAVVDEGLAAGFIGSHRLEGIRELLGIPQDVIPVGLVTIGLPAPDRRSGSLRSGWKPLEEVVHWDRWVSGRDRLREV